MKKETKTLLVGYDTQGVENILLVGTRGSRGGFKPIKMFTGKEADELYQKLISKED